MNQDAGRQAILSDQPARNDRLNFAPYAKTLAEIIADPKTDTPLTIGVFGGLGIGSGLRGAKSTATRCVIS